MTKPRVILFAAPFLLAACGSTPQDRAVTGGGIGAAGGAIVGAVTGLTVLQGALLGTGIGAAVGAFTAADSFYLGRPIWARPDRPARGSASAQLPSGSSAVADIQRDLKRLGYDPGPIDGRLGPRTKAAIARFEADQGHRPGRGEPGG